MFITARVASMAFFIEDGGKYLRRIKVKRLRL
jgi:hypothetical protein